MSASLPSPPATPTCTSSLGADGNDYDDVDDASVIRCLSREEHVASDDEDLEAALNVGPVVPGRRLWSRNIIHPAGISKWGDAKNLMAAMEYACLCETACLSKVNSIMEMYEHRKQLRSEVQNARSGSLRDVLRYKLAQHFDASLGVFTKSFVVGCVGGVCERAYAVACGVSEATFVRARADVTEKTLWHRYLRCCDKAQVPAVGSSRLLFNIWKKHSEIVELKPTGHAICDTCSAIHCERLSLEGLDGAEVRERRAELDVEAEEHQTFHTTERQHYEDAVDEATHHPESTTTLTIDAPTQHQFDLVESKLDNTTAENKNLTLIGTVGLLVAWGVFKEAVIFYMPVGHTYNELGAAFGPLITQLVRQVVATVSALVDFIHQALVGKRVRRVFVLEHLWDFDALLKQRMHKLGGYARTQQSSGMHEFHIRADSSGVVRLHARQSSQSSTWLPEVEGEPLFKEVPSRDIPPPMAQVNKGTTWRRLEVQTNVRRWLPHLGLSCEALTAAEQEWESTFASAVDDISMLPGEKQLTWKPLPLCLLGSRRLD
ncbi:MAG: hypothetical protein SGPRY_009505 [Prymnesium sp.]